MSKILLILAFSFGLLTSFAQGPKRAPAPPPADTEIDLDDESVKPAEPVKNDSKSQEYKYLELDFSQFDWGSNTQGSTKTIASVTIGTQIWMKENLNAATFRNGDPIPEAKTEEEWLNAGKEHKPAWCYYNNEEANGEKYGKLYNWFAVNDPRGLAPEGWHIPSKDEWSMLTRSLGGYGEGEKLRSAIGWREGVKNYFNSKSTNESGFTALPGQSRTDRAYFTKATDQDWGYWWSSTEFKTGSPASGWYPSSEVSKGWAYGLGSNSDLVLESYQNYGLSVRCIKE